MALANTIRQLRFHHGKMTQKELAKFVGVSRQTINAIEGVEKFADGLVVEVPLDGDDANDGN